LLPCSVRIEKLSRYCVTDVIRRSLDEYRSTSTFGMQRNVPSSKRSISKWMIRRVDASVLSARSGTVITSRFHGSNACLDTSGQVVSSPPR
jgi:hypothetical protein